MLKRTALRVMGASALLALTACASVQPTPLADTIANTPELSTLSGLIAQAGLTETLRGPGPFTVFAPSNAAFKAVPAATLAKLAGDKEALKAVITFHVVAGKLGAAEVTNGPVKSLQGAPLALAKAGTFVTVEDAVVQQADIGAANGVIHITDSVLFPPKR
jgi:uncharacterized surface protein with fasciclin (FAS1) repeats